MDKNGSCLVEGIRCDYCRGRYALVGVRSSHTFLCLYCWSNEEQDSLEENPVVDLAADSEWDGESCGGDHFECLSDEELDEDFEDQEPDQEQDDQEPESEPDQEPESEPDQEQDDHEPATKRCRTS